MKIAVLLYGHLRTFDQCANSLKENLLSLYDCDLFMHTWSETDHNTKSWHKRTTTPLSVDRNIKDNIIKYYSPKRLIIEEQPLYQGELFDFLVEPFTTVSSIGMHFMFDSMNKANQSRIDYEKEMGTKYDLVVVTRPDILFYHSLDIDKILYQAKICEIDIMKARFFAYVASNNESNVSLLINRVNDILFLANPYVIDKYISCNLQLEADFIREHLINIVTVYTAAEFKAGIQPIPIAFQYGVDWINVVPISS
ncbi:MAG: putative sugar transferase [Anaerocolumna sp.]|jgi:hypothetical protein|nr:putative sugar transferase [Anaerocolumna sp.]